MYTNIIEFCRIEQSSLSISHITGVIKDRPQSHIHDRCEIYVNLSGNVSFMVEGQLYPVKRGSVIITRPLEYHHCIYHDFSPHEHFWMLFDSTGNEALFDVFFNRPAGTKNLINLSEQDTELLLDMCHALAHKKESSQLEHYRRFFDLISLISMSEPENNQNKKLPSELLLALDKINEGFLSPMSIEKLARQCFISINTLERMFKKYLGVTPTVYIRKKRLSHAAAMLRRGFGVSFVATECGFSDVSQFISMFKKEFAQTPHRYKKNI